VDESHGFRVNIYDLARDGTVSHRRVLVDFPRQPGAGLRGGEFNPDGMIFDARGRLYVTMAYGNAINVVEVPSGKLIRQYDAGGKIVTNCHFHGGYLYTTVASKEGAVFRLKLGVQGFDYNAGIFEGRSR
jgi:sugar lactone lactonase YvrE